MRSVSELFALLFSFASPETGLWSLRPIQQPPEPAVRNEQWIRNPIDRFVLARLDREGLSPSPEASRSTLLRRVTLDLTGLPPSPEDVQNFLNDDKAGAWERVVDRLLSTSQYGEKWARHWLDQARYADSDGYRGDAFRPYAWRWRRWVIEALNRDMPFDQFTVEQIAGDLLPHATIEQQVATGFQRNTLTNREGGTDPEQFRMEAVIDRTNVVGTVWLGLTAGCAQCHDHKYDPITQRDYYRLLAFFNTAGEWHIDAPLPGEIGPHLAALPAYNRARRELLERSNVQPLQSEWERRMLEAAGQPGKWLDWDHAFDDLRTSLSDGEKILRTPPERRVPRQQKELTDYFLANYNRVITKERRSELKFEELRKALAKLDAAFPAQTEAPILREELPRRATHILQRGDYRSPGAPVEPGTPAVLPPLPVAASPSRLDLARWLVSPENPLTARVTVNRIWQQYFGRGIVKTSENFGTQGEPPSHPELLDWLAADFVGSGWRLKRLHRLIVTSAAYRQESKVRPELQKLDPGNALLARQSRIRLAAEFIRDSALAASGLLQRDTGIPSREQGYHRGIYQRAFRNKQHPFLANFDAPNGYAPVCRRMHSTTPLQALNLLNDPVFTQAAQALGLRVLNESAGFEPRLRRSFLLTLGRIPTSEEEADLRTYLERQTALLKSNAAAVEAIVPAALTSGRSQLEAAAWAGLASVLLNTDEFITRE
ncbi:MAG TPA: DUF1549 and DUF1553 domain-containing protein [Bryobacteraceae bacterium]|nr:DUF1549 and DUF1553 domain-containing protein [Bryobacteraceae bacterium]